MIISTTPTHVFTFPFDPADCQVIIITYNQGGKTILEKTKDDCEIDSEHNQIFFTLTQEETKKFNDSCALVQLKIKKDGVVSASRVEELLVYKPLNTEVI